jgi:glycosyltransferase involved in cell wall biosynthesis
MRILFVASWPSLPIGYSKVAYRVANWLAAQPEVELHYFGIGAAQCRDPLTRPLHPNIRLHDVTALEVAAGSTEHYGVDLVTSWMADIQPDVFFIYNDIIVTCRMFNALLGYRAANPGCRFISYLDLVYPFEKAALVRHVDRNTDAIFVFSPCWRRNLAAMGVPPAKIHVFPHGFDDALFRPMAMGEARQMLGLAADDFLFLNLNRNTYRKAQDIAVRAFVALLVQEAWNPRLKMILQCAPETRGGYVIGDLLEIEALRVGVPVSVVERHFLRISCGPEGLTDKEVNVLYAATDVGINTCMGEGFGLCNMEHAALGRPQVVSAVGALPDIFAEGGAILVPPRVWIRVPTALDEHTGDLGVCDADDFTAAMSLYFHDAERREADGAFAAQKIGEAFCWESLLAAFWSDFRSHL